MTVRWWPPISFSPFFSESLTLLGLGKGQLISECPFGIIVWTKYQRNYFWISALKFFVPSWGLPGSFWGLPVGFPAYDITY